MNPECAPHELHQADAVAGPLGLAVGRVDGLAPASDDGGLETERLLDEGDVVVDGLGDADHADFQAPPPDLLGDGLGPAQGAVAADREQDAHVHPLQGVDHLDDVLGAAGRAQDGAACSWMSARRRSG